MELIKQIEINIDYIIELIKKYHSDNTKNKEILADINRAIESSVALRNKKDLIEQFIKSLDISAQVDGDWLVFVEKKKKEELDKIIEEE
jgi:type I restriction enzyme R subunit